MTNVKLNSNLTLGDAYDVFSNYELVIKDHVDNFMIWCGNYEDMPIKYACVVIKEVNMDINEIEVLV